MSYEPANTNPALRADAVSWVVEMAKKYPDETPLRVLQAVLDSFLYLGEDSQ